MSHVYEELVGACVITPAPQPGFLPGLPYNEPDTAASDQVLLDRDEDAQEAEPSTAEPE